MDFLENLKELVSESCYNDIVSIVENLINEEWNALDHILGGQGATDKLAAKAGSQMMSGLKKTAPIRNTIGRSKVHQAGVELNQAEKNYQNLKNANKTFTCPAEERAHKQQLKQLNKVANQKAQNYNSTKAEYGIN